MRVVSDETTIAALQAEVAQLRRDNKELAKEARVAVRELTACKREFVELTRKLWARGEGPDGKPLPEGAPAP